MKKPRKEYVSVKALKKVFGEAAEAFTARFGMLTGLDRLSGYTDTKGKVWGPAWNVHVDGLAFRCESIPCAIAFLEGVTAGFEFSACGPARFVTRLEVENLIREAIEKGLNK